MKRNKITILTILLAVIVMAAPASAFITSQNTETKAERMVEIAANGQEAVMDITARLEANATAKQMLLDADLDEQFYGNVSLCVEAGTLVNGTEATDDGEGWTYLNAAKTTLLAEEYEDAISNAREALAIFRDVLRSMNDLLFDSGIETTEIVDAHVIQEAIDRSRDRIDQLQVLIDDGHELQGNLTDADDYLDEAQNALDDGNIEDAKEALGEANSIISYVCGELKEIANNLNPGRINSYLVKAQQFRERFRERFGHASDEDIDVAALVQALGYSNEEEFMAELQQMIQNAKDAKDIKDAINALKDFSRMAMKMDNAITEEFGQKGGNGEGNGQGNGQGLSGNGKGYGNMGGGNSP